MSVPPAGNEQEPLWFSVYFPAGSQGSVEQMVSAQLLKGPRGYQSSYVTSLVYGCLLFVYKYE